MKDSYHLSIKERSGKDIRSYPVQFGVPLPKGKYYLSSELILETRDKNNLPCEIIATCFWPDKSIKWCLAKSTVDLSSNQELFLSISKNLSIQPTVSNITPCLTESNGSIEIKTKNCVFSLDTDQFGLLRKVVSNNIDLACDGYCNLNTTEGENFRPAIRDYGFRHSIANETVQSVTVQFRGDFIHQSGSSFARFETSMEFFIDTDTMKCSFSIHNPKTAIHSSGLWDLGDPNSLIFSSLDLGFRITNIDTTKWKAEPDDSWNSTQNQPLIIYQESSGGKNWNSPNHVDRTNTVPLTLNGYECRSQSSVIHSGRRASPVILINTGTRQLSASIRNFWQNCPKSLAVEDDRINIGLFPRQFTSGYELQPGEKKTHTFYFDFSMDGSIDDHLDASVEISLNPLWVEETGVFPYFSANTIDDTLYRIIQQGLTGENNFYAKREVIDEYGWRNFGDLYADHETDGYEGKEPFISHYNNQYDPIYGFLRQFALSGKVEWFDLADDLAHHLMDIDIYHTSYDKEEYNKGMFWHTDHYLQAKTSSHRSYSKFQPSNAYIDHAGGGGPGGQHCYTSGLLYHYLMTGNAGSRSAVIELTDWVTCVYEGSGTLFDVLLAIKNRNRIDLKNITTGKYPLDRGTGNYINALLDKYALTQERSILHQIEHIIQNTVHPSDDVTARDLNNAEVSWYYTVFFQSLCRFLQTKEELPSLDEAFYYARDSLLHYADWMAENEYPYLTKPEILEFPNHTWTAQDLRKVNILIFANYYSPDSSSIYSRKLEEIYSYITTNLKNEKTRTYTRILAILMQNHGAIEFFKTQAKSAQFGPVRTYAPLKNQNLPRVLWNINMAFIKAIRHFSLKKELRWLGRRSQTFARLIRYTP